MKNILLILLVTFSNICCMNAQNIERKMIFSYKGESDKPIPTIILSVNEFTSKGYPFFKFCRIDEKLFDTLNKIIEQSKDLIKSTSSKESLYEILVINGVQSNLYLCPDKHCIRTTTDIINALIINKTPTDIIKAFESIKKRIK